jgi:hypothetical protein
MGYDGFKKKISHKPELFVSKVEQMLHLFENQQLLKHFEAHEAQEFRLSAK